MNEQVQTELKKSLMEDFQLQSLQELIMQEEKILMIQFYLKQ